MKYNSMDILNGYKDSDCGMNGKTFEQVIRYIITPKTHVNRVQCPSRADILKKVDNKRCNVEVKTACGAIQYNVSYTSMDEVNISALMPNVDYVVYCPEVNHSIAYDLQGFVFTREQFLDFLCGYPSMIRLRRTTQGNTDIGIQSFNNSKKKSAYVWDYCYSMPTVREWIASL